MGWSYRQSLGSGPFRINFSKSGISYSVGVKGARVNFGPKGTFVNLSSHGISYRKKISGGQPSGVSTIPRDLNTPQTTDGTTHYIGSAAVEQLTDTDSKDFIEELTQKAAQISYIRWFGICPLIILLSLWMYTSFSSQEVVLQPASDSTLVRVTSYPGVYIRKSPTSSSPALRTAVNGEFFQLAGDAKANWVKITFRDSIGYINRRFIMIENVHHDPVTQQEPYLANPYTFYELIAGAIFFGWLIPRLKKADRERFAMELNYEMDEQFQQVYQEFGRHFENFSSSARVWQYLNSHHINDAKRNAGAGKLIKRAIVPLITSHRVPIHYFVTNIQIPYIKLSNIELFFLPERLLIKRGNTFGAVFYKNLRVDGADIRFIEDGSVPYDAKIVDRTWQYVNKSGGQDRRFNNNRQLPVCAYSEYTLRSQTGIYEVISTSKKGAMDGFANFLLMIGRLQGQMAMN